MTDKANEIWQVRQGDVLITRVEKAPTHGAEVPREGGRVVLAHGEATGHAHALLEPRVKLYDRELAPATGPEADALWREAQRFLEIGAKKGATLRHEEHGPIELPPGDYEITRQREYDPWANRMVAD